MVLWKILKPMWPWLLMDICSSSKLTVCIRFKVSQVSDDQALRSCV